MRVVGQLGQILGPRGLMPIQKTHRDDRYSNAVKNAKMGQFVIVLIKAGVVHCTIGKADFDSADLADNLNAILTALKKSETKHIKRHLF